MDIFVIDELIAIRLTDLFVYGALVDYRLKYSRRMGTIGPGEARNCPVPNAKPIGDPSRRWDNALRILPM